MKHILPKFNQTDPWRKIVLENALDAVVGMDQSSKVIDWNAQAEIVFGWTKAEAMGKVLSEMVIPEVFRKAHHQGVKHFLQTGEGPILNSRIEVMAKKKDGSTFPVELTVIPVNIEDTFVFYSFIRDISERKKTEEIRQKLSENISFLSETTKVLLSDPLGLDSRLNKFVDMILPQWGMACILDIADSQEMITESIIAIQEADTKDIQVLHHEYPQQSVKQIEMEKLGPEANEYIQKRFSRGLAAKSILFLPLAAHKKSIGTLTLISDQTSFYDQASVDILSEAAKRSAFAIFNAQLYEEATEAVKARDEFLSIASHELKTPMTSIMLMTQLYLRKNPENEISPDLKKLIDLIDKNLSRMLRLIEDMLDISRIAHGKIRFEKKEMDIGLLIEDILQRRNAEISTTMSCLSTDIAKNLTGIWDMYRIEQVLSNLINNALKYAPKTELRISAKREGNLVHIIFSDTGKGIEPENLDKIFQRFERVIGTDHVGGLGLGLYISRQIIEAHGGEIWAESESGKGSNFHIELPLK